MITNYCSTHIHTDSSNLRIIDSINKVNDVIEYCHSIGLSGCAITDHETIAAHIKAQEYVNKQKKNKPDEWDGFKLILGNEIYLCRDGLNSDNFIGGEDKYYHFILLAKDEIGHRQLNKLSARAWRQSYMSFMRRVPTYYSDIEDIVGNESGHIIASTACLGGYVGTNILKGEFNKVDNFLNWCIDIFGKENFYLEMQPSAQDDQIKVNNYILTLSKKHNIPYIITTDAHYLKKEDREIHKAYLNSKDGDRETDDFYSSTYIMTAEEIHSYLDSNIGADAVEVGLENTLKIVNSCKEYSLLKSISLPYMPLAKDNERKITQSNITYLKSHPNMLHLKELANSSEDAERFLAHLILDRAEKDNLNQKQQDLIETELNYLQISSKTMGMVWAKYLLQVRDYNSIYWKYANTLVGPGRGSAVSEYINYLIGITQIDPSRELAPVKPWRFINPERASVLDIDIDIEGTKRDACIEALQHVYGAEHVVRVCTFGTEKAKSAILTAARGLGIDDDTAHYLSSMIESERGIQRTLSETFYGDVEKDIKPNRQFCFEMENNYPLLWKVAQSIEGLINHVGIHAGGVVIVEGDLTDDNSVMKTNRGIEITQYELHDLEKVGQIKIDLLAVECLDKIHCCLDLLVKYGYIKRYSTLRETYENAIGVYKIDRLNKEMWKMVWDNKILSLFQMEAPSGIKGIALTHPTTVEDLATLNSIIRLMASEKGAEQPLDKYKRFRDSPADWELEMNMAGLTEYEKSIIRKHLTISYGICECQESMMSLLQEPEIAGWGLGQVDKVRKSIAKKDPKLYEALTKEFFDNAKEKNLSPNLTNYVWNVLVNTQRGYSFDNNWS